MRTVQVALEDSSPGTSPLPGYSGHLPSFHPTVGGRILLSINPMEGLAFGFWPACATACALKAFRVQHTVAAGQEF